MECKANVTLDICGCVEFFGIRKNLKPLKIIFLCSSFFIGDKTMRVCNEFGDKSCYEKAMLATQSETCKCFPACTSIEFAIKNYEERTKSKDEHNSSLTIQFASDEFIVYRRYASLGTVTLLSNIGGLLGLFLGLSALSVVEIFYFFVIKFISNLWWKEKTWVN
jgi:acid-sensing ion channel, other